MIEFLHVILFFIVGIIVIVIAVAADILTRYSALDKKYPGFKKRMNKLYPQFLNRNPKRIELTLEELFELENILYKEFKGYQNDPDNYLNIYYKQLISHYNHPDEDPKTPHDTTAGRSILNDINQLHKKFAQQHNITIESLTEQEKDKIEEALYIFYPRFEKTKLYFKNSCKNLENNTKDVVYFNPHPNPQSIQVAIEFNEDKKRVENSNTFAFISFVGIIIIGFIAMSLK